MSDTYDLYSNVHSIARHVVMSSKGLGFRHLDKEVLLADVDKAAHYAGQAEKYWSLLQELGSAKAKVSAAKILDVDPSEYERDVTVLERRFARSSDKMNDIVKGYKKVYGGGWAEVK